jgi:hypothetical protein
MWPQGLSVPSGGRRPRVTTEAVERGVRHRLDPAGENVRVPMSWVRMDHALTHGLLG